MELRDLLKAVQTADISLEKAYQEIIGFKKIGYATVDTERQKRNGFSEVIYGQGKTISQIKGIIATLLEENTNEPILVTRIDQQKGQALQTAFSKGCYYPEAACFVLAAKPIKGASYIAIVTAGTSDLAVAEEAAVTAETFGHAVERIYDVGVAGIHRLFNQLEKIQKASVIIAIAGMEGALVSVLAGLVDVPIIAVPTSVGYGSNLQGFTALMSMLTACSSGVTVVNIDNGFGAAYSASMINQLQKDKIT